MLVGLILACRNGMRGSPPGEVPSRPSPSDEYDARVPRAFRREEQKSVMLLIACADSQCWARSRAADYSTRSLGL